MVFIKQAPHLPVFPDCFNNDTKDPEYRWDHSGNHPTRLYFRNRAQFYMCDFTTQTGAEATLIHDFTDVIPGTTFIYNDDEGDSSANSRYWAFMCRDGDTPLPDTTLGFIVYDKQTDTIIGTKNLPEGISRPNFIDIAPDGSKVLVSWYNRYLEGDPYVNSEYDGPHVYDLDFANPKPVGAYRATTHSGWAYDVNGNLV